MGEDTYDDLRSARSNLERCITADVQHLRERFPGLEVRVRIRNHTVAGPDGRTRIVNAEAEVEFILG